MTWSTAFMAWKQESQIKSNQIVPVKLKLKQKQKAKPRLEKTSVIILTSQKANESITST